MSHVEFRPGNTVFERYRISRMIGAGFVGVVYEAQHWFTGKTVALKVTKARVGDLSLDGRSSWELEAQMIMRLRHRYVARVFDTGITQQGVIWWAMDLLCGRTLRDLIYLGGALPVDRALRFGVQIALGVQAAHDAYLLHRDLKPENLFVVEPEDEIRVLDAGMLRFGPTDAATDLVGTCAYLSPERFQRKPPDRSADIYALGHILFEMLTGRHCFSRGIGPLELPGPQELALLQMFAEPPPLRMWAPAVPPYVATLVERALSKHAEERPPSMAQFAAELGAALERFQEGEQLEPRVLPDTEDAARGTGLALCAPPRWALGAIPPELPIEARVLLGALRLSVGDPARGRVAAALWNLVVCEGGRQIGLLAAVLVAVVSDGGSELEDIRLYLCRWAESEGGDERSGNALVEFVEWERMRSPQLFTEEQGGLQLLLAIRGALHLMPPQITRPTAVDIVRGAIRCSGEDLNLVLSALAVIAERVPRDELRLLELLGVLAQGHDSEKAPARRDLIDLLRPTPASALPPTLKNSEESQPNRVFDAGAVDSGSPPEAGPPPGESFRLAPWYVFLVVLVTGILALVFRSLLSIQSAMGAQRSLPPAGTKGDTAVP